MDKYLRNITSIAFLGVEACGLLASVSYGSQVEPRFRRPGNGPPSSYIVAVGTVYDVTPVVYRAETPIVST